MHSHKFCMKLPLYLSRDITVEQNTWIPNLDNLYGLASITKVRPAASLTLQTIVCWSLSASIYDGLVDTFVANSVKIDKVVLSPAIRADRQKYKHTDIHFEKNLLLR